MSKQQYNMRFDPDLIRWVDGVSSEMGTNRTAFVEGLLEAAREGRLLARPRGPEAFPQEATPAGSTPEYPILLGGF